MMRDDHKKNLEGRYTQSLGNNALCSGYCIRRNFPMSMKKLGLKSVTVSCQSHAGVIFQAQQ